MTDPEISQTNFIPVHHPKSSTSSSSYDPEISAGNSSYEDSSGDDKDSSLSGLEEACSTLQIDTNSGSSTESVDGLADSPRRHQNQSLAAPTVAGINNPTTPLAETVCSTSDTDSLMVAMAPLGDISQAFSMIAVCDTALRFHPPPGIDGMVMAPAASNDTLPAHTIKKAVQHYEDMPAAV